MLQKVVQESETLLSTIWFGSTTKSPKVVQESEIIIKYMVKFNNHIKESSAGK